MHSVTLDKSDTCPCVTLDKSDTYPGIIRPQWWPFQGYEAMIQSLHPPCVPECINDGVHHSEWFNTATAEAVMEKQPKTWRVLHTFRTDAFQKRIRDLLAQEELTFDSMRFRGVCKCCSPLGFTHTGSAGYGRLADYLTTEPERAEDKHLLVILGDVLNDCKAANEVVLYLSTKRTRTQHGATRAQHGAAANKAFGPSSSQYSRICKLFALDTSTETSPETAACAQKTFSDSFTLVVRGIDPNPCLGPHFTCFTGTKVPILTQKALLYLCPAGVPTDGELAVIHCLEQVEQRSSLLLLLPLRFTTAFVCSWCADR